jgi:hypothetical protein
MHVLRVDTDHPGQVRRFIEFPYDLYQGNSYWVPPLKSELESVMDRGQYPFFEHSTADFFIAEKGGEVVGRIAVADNSNYNEYTGERAAFFYYFETVEDLEVARALFEAAERWASDHGLERVMGPKGFIHGDGLGMLVEGYDREPGTGIAYNPPCYPRFLTKLDYEPYADYLSGYLHHSYELPERVFELADRVKERRGLSVVSYDSKEELRALAPRLREIYNKAFHDVPGFCPITEAEMEVIAGRILSVARPELIKMVMKGEEIVGFLFGYPNVNDGLRKANGSLWPLGWLHLFLDFHRTKTVDLNGIGMLPGHQGVGGTAVLYAEMERTIRSFDYEHANMIQIYEHNLKSMGDATSLGVEWVQRHRIYAREI